MFHMARAYGIYNLVGAGKSWPQVTSGLGLFWLVKTQNLYRNDTADVRALQWNNNGSVAVCVCVRRGGGGGDNKCSCFMHVSSM